MSSSIRKKANDAGLVVYITTDKRKSVAESRPNGSLASFRRLSPSSLANTLRRLVRQDRERIFARREQARVRQARAACPSCVPVVSLAGLKATAVQAAPSRRSVASTLVVVILAVALCMSAAMLFRWAVPPATAVESPYFATNVKAAVSTPVQDWERGSLPHLYMADAQWSQEPYGHATVGLAGAAPTSLAMACVKMTGDTTLDPAHFATFATENNLTANDELTLETLIETATASCGLEAVSLDVDELSLRRALARGNAVIVVTKPGTFSLLPSCLAVERINAKSELDIVDPASALRSGKSWTFSDILNASATVYAVRSSAS